jgi:uncharacterized protein
MAADEPLVHQSFWRRKLSRRQLLALSGMGLASIAYPTQVETNWLELTHTIIPIKDLPKAFEGYRIGVVSDTHYPENNEPGFMGRIGEMLQSAKVDVVCVPGDLADESGRPNLDFRGIFDNWTAPDGQFCTLGNHDHWYGAEDVIKQIRDHTPLKLVDNDRVLIERGGEAIVLAGVGDYTDGIVDADKALGKLDPDMPRILLSHNPDLAHDFPDGHRVDLQLSGHTHGGQISLFGYAPIIPSRYGQTFCRGLVQGRKNLVYVTRGVCRWTFHARLCSRPEVSVIELTAK